jgi:hypothetical protein
MKQMLPLLSAILFFSCTTKETIIEYQELEVPVEVERIVTLTVTQTVIVAPDEYSFTRNGVPTVYYTGQSARMKMATELKGHMNNPAQTEANIDTMFGDGTGFDDATLDTSGKNVRSKTAASAVAASTIRPLFDGWIEDFITNVAPAVNNGAVAEAGVAGEFTGPGGRTVKVNAKGLELNQVFSKGLIGALQTDQIVNGYLSFAKLDGARQDNDDDIYAYTFPGHSEANITKMEHYWDEGFGYLQGLDNQYKAGLGEAPNRDGANLNYYLNKVNNTYDPGITERIYEAFSIGRAAIVAKDYEVRDAQAEIIRTEISKVIGIRADYYLQQGSVAITNNDMGAAFHDLSEGIGFVYSLQFTRQPGTNAQLFTRAEVQALIANLLDDGENGLWNITPESLQEVSEAIASKFSFTVAQAGSAQ